MKILLFLSDKLVEFKLPTEVLGSFSFDDKENEENKLINVEAIDGNWYLYSTSDVTIFDNNQVVKNMKIEENHFYELKRDNDTFLIYVQSLYERTLMPYLYDDRISIILGNNEGCNIKYNCKYIDDILFNIEKKNGMLLLNIISSKVPVYVNKKRFLKGSLVINNGDRLNVFGLNIFFLSNSFLINNPNNSVFINEVKANINFCILPKQDEYSLVDVKDKDLYSENSYFSKSSRIRRFIETKEIKLDPPPKDGNNDDTPFLMVVGPMLTMGITSAVTLVSTINRINSGETTVSASWPQLVTGSAMLLSTMLWPVITKVYSKKQKVRKEKELLRKYTLYLKKKEKEFSDELKLQQDILLENLITLEGCLEIISKRGILFWNKRNDENDFLNVRVGTGDVKLKIDVRYPEEGFTIDEDALKDQADALVEKYKYIKGAPMGYSLYDNTVTAVMGDRILSTSFINNIILQLLTFYSYEDLKIVVFTNESNKEEWDYIKYLYHNFTDDKSFRFFASNSDSGKNVTEFLNFEINNRASIQSNDKINYKPYYLVIVDDYSMVKKSLFLKKVTESEKNLGCSILLAENKLSRLPSKCTNFISLTSNRSEILINSYEKQEKINFNNEINPNINMKNIAKYLSNIPIEFEEGIRQLPDAINFLEMEKVGKVEQLNILNRWNTNDSTTSLKAEVGVDETGNLMYLDLHEKFHGPHGLIAGMTGSGKSEFIITYILSMAINYSPEYVSFILIDYKGGGLAGAFENKVTGISLPHLAGTITNLDKSEMDRTLVSIDSEIKRRQKKFNEARDALGESTIDIYKYQRFYKDGKISEPIPHLFIICDEFAELKSQQPDFMDNLISVARIGRSLGVHLILATQKPSGVVNDQIWSNTKFRVCLKVQDEQDSKEMLKKPDAAGLKQVGRFYLQVGYDEYYALGQSAWCGAKYFPSNKMMKQVDKSLNFINDNGFKIKNVQAGTGVKMNAQGEQLSSIMKSIIEVSRITKKVANRLWLENLSSVILVDDLIKKYNVSTNLYDVKAIIGEYDAPEKQEQGLIEYSFLKDGNTIIYGLDGSEREMLLNSIMYSSMIGHTSDEINYYIVDYGSESLRRFSNFSSVGGMVYAGEEDKFKNLIKLIKNEIARRKKLYSSYGGEYINYINKNDKKEPIKVFVFNNFDSIFESHQDMYDYLPGLVRDSERYGIIFILTANAINSVSIKISQNFGNIYAFRLKDSSDYNTIFNSRKKIELRDIFGRGLLNNGELHEFQTSSIVSDSSTLDDYIYEFSKKIDNRTSAKSIPTLPEVVDYDMIKQNVSSLSSVPVGISRQELEIVNYDFTLNTGTVITSSKLLNTTKFINSLVNVLINVQNTDLLFIDGTGKLSGIGSTIKYFYNLTNFDAKKGIFRVSEIDDVNNVTKDMIDRIDDPSSAEFKIGDRNYSALELRNMIDSEIGLKNSLLNSVENINDPLLKTRKLYIELNKKLHYDMDFFKADDVTKSQILNKTTTFENIGKGNKVICKGWSELFRELLIDSGFDEKNVRINTSGIHRWVEVDLGNGYIIHADATEAINNSIDLATCKAGFGTSGFICINNETGNWSGVRPKSIVESESNKNIINSNNQLLLEIDQYLGYAGNEGYFADEVIKAKKLFGISRKFSDKMVERQLDAIFNIEIPPNIDGYEVFVYYKKISDNLFGSNNNPITLNTLYLKTDNGIEPINYMSDGSRRFQLYSTSFGIKRFDNLQDLRAFEQSIGLI